MRVSVTLKKSLIFFLLSFGWLCNRLILAFFSLFHTFFVHNYNVSKGGEFFFLICVCTRVTFITFFSLFFLRIHILFHPPDAVLFLQYSLGKWLRACPTCDAREVVQVVHGSPIGFVPPFFIAFLKPQYFCASRLERNLHAVFDAGPRFFRVIFFFCQSVNKAHHVVETKERETLLVQKKKKKTHDFLFVLFRSLNSRLQYELQFLSGLFSALFFQLHFL